MSGKVTEIIEQSQAEVDQLEQDSDEEEILAIQEFMGVAESGSVFRLSEDLKGLLKLRADRTHRPEAEIVYEILAEALAMERPSVQPQLGGFNSGDPLGRRGT